MPRRQPAWALAVAAPVVAALAVLTWYVWYPLARRIGIDSFRTAQFIAQAVSLLTAMVLVFALRLSWRGIGLGMRSLAKALAVMAMVYAVFLGLSWLLLASELLSRPILRRITFLGLFENWFLTGLGEELLFSGVLYTLTLCVLASRRWRAVLLVALMFALWHLPGYLARDMAGTSIMGRLGLNLASWRVIGGAYAMSRNLWLVALAHGSMGYSPTPLITGSPLLGLVSMALTLGGAWWLGQHQDRNTVAQQRGAGHDAWGGGGP